VADDTTAIQAAIDAVKDSSREGGKVIVPKGKYLVTSTILLYSGVSLEGESRGRLNGVVADGGSTVLYAQHTGASGLSLKGAGHCVVKNIYIESDATTYPKTGLLLGRSSSSSAGHHWIENVRVQGKFTNAAVYSIASEVNTLLDVYVWNLSGGGKYGYYTSANDDLSVDSLTGSTNLVQNLQSLYVINQSADANAACIYLECDESMGSWNFYNAYCIPAAGSYVQLHNTTDSQILGPVSFYGCSGERFSGGDPLYGFRISSDVTWNFKGFTAIGCRFDFLADATHKTIDIDSNTTLTCPNVVLQPPEAFPYAVATYDRAKILGGIFRVAREYEWTAITLAGSWINQFGSPYVQAGYTVDCQGRVTVRGTVSGGTGTIFTLPANYRPSDNMFFSTTGNGAVARILITATTGVVSLFSGAEPNVDLSCISFIAEE
jgi:hypothetical protein